MNFSPKVREQRLPFIGMCGLLAGLLAPAVGAAEAPKDAVDYNRDIRPILSSNCFACHGFDANTRQGGLRLDVPEGAFAAGKSGKKGIVPRTPDHSEVMARVMAKDGKRMPPGKELSAKEIDLLRRWIEQGAQFAPHWAFTAPKRPALPAVKNAKWGINPIDRFTLARMEKAGLKPSPTADRATLIRRLTFDLTGLPPTVAEINAFLSDTGPGAYERVVDRLLGSPRYGERMALEWLDLSRYADTHGYHIDSGRDMWPWRNWVIDAFNRNLSYDQFVIQQLAGDLLPNATLDQKIATGFNRNHPINFEGGAIPEEYHAAYVFDRVDTTATAFMGLTMKCAQCHDHKYDPLTQKDFYKFFAYFNNVPEQGLDGQAGNAAPFIKAPTPAQSSQLAEYAAKIAQLEKATAARVAETAPAQAEWEKTALSTLENSSLAAGLVGHYRFDETAGESVVNAAQGAGARVVGKAAWTGGKVGGALNLDGASHADLGAVTGFDRTDKFSYGGWVRPADKGAMTVVSRMDDAAGIRGWDLYIQDGKVFVHLIHQWDGNALRVNTTQPFEYNQWRHLFVTYDGSSKAAGVKIYVDGKPAAVEVTHDALTGTIVVPGAVHVGRRNPGAPFRGAIDEIRLYNRELSVADVAQLAGADAIRQLLTTVADKRTPEQRAELQKYYLEKHDAPYGKLSAELASWRGKRTELDKSIPTTMVMQEMEKPRETHLLVRGAYDQKGDKVAPGVPGVLPPLPADAPPNRLGLARWLVDPSHPLTARVAVNRYWQTYFGNGIVKSAENFGVQSERPTHPELLDWLATEFIRTGWDVKAMQRLIVTSATYRQSSAVSPELQRKDPENLLLARAPRFRLPAEFVRDQALAVSGLLVDTIGGRSVKPYHPAGLWEEMSFGGSFSEQNYVQEHGDALYRRSMYTFWKRTVPPPSLQTFDAPEREFCIVRRGTTNTPLQALVLMNDPTYMEAARKFGERLLTEIAATPKDRLRYAFRLALARQPKDEELRILMDLYNERLAAFRKDPASATKLLSVGESKRNEKLDAVELAAWAAVSSAILNLDETITKN